MEFSDGASQERRGAVRPLHGPTADRWVGEVMGDGDGVIENRCGHRWQRGRTGQGGWAAPHGADPDARDRSGGWDHAAALCGDDPLQRKRQRVPRGWAVRSGRPEAPVCPRHRQVDHLGLPVCRVGTGRLDEGEDAHWAATLGAQQGIRLIDLFDEVRPALLERPCERGGGTSMIDTELHSNDN